MATEARAIKAMVVARPYEGRGTPTPGRAVITEPRMPPARRKPTMGQTESAGPSLTCHNQGVL